MIFLIPISSQLFLSNLLTTTNNFYTAATTVIIIAAAAFHHHHQAPTTATTARTIADKSGSVWHRVWTSTAASGPFIAAILSLIFKLINSWQLFAGWTSWQPQASSPLHRDHQFINCCFASGSQSTTTNWVRLNNNNNFHYPFQQIIH